MADSFAKQQSGQPLEASLGLFGGTRRSARVPSTRTIGAPGTAIYGGFIVEEERDSTLTGKERYRTYSNILGNCTIVAAGVRYFLNLMAKASWQFVPAEVPQGVQLAEQAEQILTDDPETSWAGIIRTAAMYRFWGFSFQEWTARRRDDGIITFADIAPRSQRTIERWDPTDAGALLGVVQRSPQTHEEIYLPRGKLLYMVDKSISDSPDGLGLFRHIVAAARRLKRYEQLEGFGYETDLRGIPVVRAPYEELRREVQNNSGLTESEAIEATQQLELFAQKHVKNPELGLALDSATYTTIDEAGRPSNVYKYDVSLLTGDQTSMPDMRESILRLTREIARVLSVENILLGDGDRGSFALARDKTQQLSLTVDSTLTECADQFRKDLLGPIWRLNGWPEEAMPRLMPEAAAYRDVEQIGETLRNMAQAGVQLNPGDEAVPELFALLGLTPPDTRRLEEDLSLLRRQRTPGGNPAPRSPNRPDPDDPGAGATVPNRPNQEPTP